MARTNGDALSIQWIDVAKVAPTDGQGLIFDATTLQYVPWDAWGWGLSPQDQTKLNWIEEWAEKNVQSDRAETDNTSDSFIQNKPTIPDAEAITASNWLTRTWDDIELWWTLEKATTITSDGNNLKVAWSTNSVDILSSGRLDVTNNANSASKTYIEWGAVNVRWPVFWNTETTKITANSVSFSRASKNLISATTAGGYISLVPNASTTWSVLLDPDWNVLISEMPNAVPWDLPLMPEWNTPKLAVIGWWVLIQVDNINWDELLAFNLPTKQVLKQMTDGIERDMNWGKVRFDSWGTWYTEIDTDGKLDVVSSSNSIAVDVNASQNTTQRGINVRTWNPWFVSELIQSEVASSSASWYAWLFRNKWWVDSTALRADATGTWRIQTWNNSSGITTVIGNKWWLYVSEDEGSTTKDTPSSPNWDYVRLYTKKWVTVISNTDSDWEEVMYIWTKGWARAYFRQDVHGGSKMIMNIVMPRYADDAAAVAWGLIRNDLYRTNDGTVKQVL